MNQRFPILVNTLGLWLHKIGAFVFLPALAVLITLDVILRYVLGSPLIWSHEANGLFLLIVFLGSLTHCWNKGRHVRMLMLFRLFKGRMRLTADIIAELAGILFFGLLGFKCFREIPFMIKTNETGELLMVPHWPFKAFIGICCLIFVLRMLIALYGTLFHKEAEEIQQ